MKRIKQVNVNPIRIEIEENYDDGFSHKSSIDDYTIGKVIGTGAYAVVRVGMNNKSKQKVAIKIYEK
jgi:serine/threonine protein kinase